MRALAVLAVVALLAAPAQARSSRDVGYAYESVWPTLVRFLRVDEKVKIVEKDAEAGYVLFELTDEKRTFSGSAELVRRKDADTVRIVLSITDRPAWMEEGMLDRLEKKLRGELGEPSKKGDASGE